MSYGAAAALQAAIYEHLTLDPALAGVAVYDAVPAGPAGTFVLLGPEEVRDASDATGAGGEHRLVISVISDAAGFLAAKTIAAAISDRLAGADLTLTRGDLVSVAFLKAVAQRLDEGTARRIDLSFRARIAL
ncbi:DUF3168 domain-containing protein [Xinfangfangia sp. CPCC 101601]|uniref:DUF3168 domain-containing protein n=1 Tax=Pseudogemmobacter lacusdianii TaxID=3069608 RepID=A0ABU0W124_9RHOB|nr:DUF3168 domain-containing protein [Xinfangfangia sp. CPCC 101601]MDQ2067698.1 DUF3168 domain-containing protein [Xinfangfangia sp. CPCC 101601]